MGARLLLSGWMHCANRHYWACCRASHTGPQHCCEAHAESKAQVKMRKHKFRVLHSVYSWGAMAASARIVWSLAECPIADAHYPGTGTVLMLLVNHRSRNSMNSGANFPIMAWVSFRLSIGSRGEDSKLWSWPWWVWCSRYCPIKLTPTRRQSASGRLGRVRRNPMRRGSPADDSRDGNPSESRAGCPCWSLTLARGSEWPE